MSKEFLNKKEERRNFPRISINFPIKIPPSFLAQSVDVSETGLSFILEKPFLLSKAKAEIEISPQHKIETDFKVIWSKQLMEAKKFHYGVAFVRFKEKDLDLLKSLIFKTYKFRNEFIDLTKKMRRYLRSLKEKFDRFDKKNSSPSIQVKFIERNKQEIFKYFDNHFKNIWDIVKALPKDLYKEYQRYYQHMLHPFLEIPIEVNRHIYRKPLGYGGDFITMNYILDYHKDNYLGNSSYEKLINNYTCNIPISCSNILRKKFFKEKILEMIKKKSKAKILSVGSGPIRELMEILNEKKINCPFIFNCLDFDKKALDWVRSKMRDVYVGEGILEINFLHINIKNLIKNQELKRKIGGVDFIYASGIFDYLSSRICSRLTKELYQLLNAGGVLIICNISQKGDFHRSYYEFLGEWVMHHRTQEKMVTWIRGIEPLPKIKFEDLGKENRYLYLTIEKYG